MPTMPRWSLSFLGCLLVGVSPAAAWAADAPRSLRDAIVVEPGATCLNAATLVDDVASWLGPDVVTTDMVVEVRGSADDPRVVTFRTLREARVVAQRRFAPAPAKCDHMHAMVALAIAMALRASLVDEVAPERSSPPPPRPDERAEPERAWEVGADVLASFAVLPDAAFGAGVRVERALGPVLRARLGVLTLVAWGETFDGAPGRFDTWLVAPRADLCAAFALSSRVRAEGCVGVATGWLRAAGEGFATSQVSSEWWSAAANGLDFAIAVGSGWSLDLGATLILPLARNRIVLRQPSGAVDQARDLGSVGLTLGAGPRFLF